MPITAQQVKLPEGGITEVLGPADLAPVTTQQIARAHAIAREKMLLNAAGKPKPQYRRLAKALTGETSIAKMTETEANTFINALDRLVMRGNKPPRIPKNAFIITKEFADKIPLLNEIGAIERLRPARQVFEKVGLGEEIFWNALEKEALYGVEYGAFEKQLYKLAKGIGRDRRQAIFRWLEGDKKIKLTQPEEDAAKFIKEFMDGAANRLGLPMEQRRKNYITHLFERSIEEDLKAKHPIDGELVRALDYITPKTIFHPYLQKRLGKKVGLLEDPFLATDVYARRTFRKLHYEPLIRKIRVYEPILASTGRPNAARYLRSYITRITGRPLQIDREMNTSVRQVADALGKSNAPFAKKLASLLKQGDFAGLAAYQYTSFLYFSWLGFKPSSAIRNLSQQALTICDVGPLQFARGIGLKHTAEGKWALKQSVLLKSRYRAFVPGIDASFTSRWSDAVREKSLWMFRRADRTNVENSFLAGYAEARSFGLSKEWAVKRGDEVAADTQYVYTRFGSAEWSQSTIGRVLSPLTTWPANWLELMGKWIGGRGSYVYKRYQAQMGKKIAQASWGDRKRAVLAYIALVSMAYGIQTGTPLRASEYTGWTSTRYLKDIIGGELPALDLPRAFAQVIFGALQGDKASVNAGLNRLRPTQWINIIRQLERIAQGKTDWLSLFFYIDPEKMEAPAPTKGGIKTFRTR